MVFGNQSGPQLDGVLAAFPIRHLVCLCPPSMAWRFSRSNLDGILQPLNYPHQDRVKSSFFSKWRKPPKELSLIFFASALGHKKEALHQFWFVGRVKTASSRCSHSLKSTQCRHVYYRTLSPPRRISQP